MVLLSVAYITDRGFYLQQKTSFFFFLNWQS